MNHLINLFLFAFSLHGLILNAQIKVPDLKSKLETDLEKNIQANKNTISNQAKYFMDSIHEILKLGDTVILKYSLSDIKSNFKNLKKDSITYSSLEILLPKKNTTEFSYPVKKDDTLQVYIKHNSLLKIKNVEILFGKIPVYSKIKLNRKSQINKKIPAMEDGEITIKITNRNYLPIKSKLFVRNLKKEKKINIKEVIDTIYKEDTSIVTKGELQYVPLAEQTFQLGATLNLTKTPYFMFPIPFDISKNGTGWVYWLGYSEKNVSEFKNLKSDIDPLIAYSTNQLHFLPVSEQKNLTCAFVNESNAKKLTRGENFAPLKLNFSPNNGPNYGKIIEPTSKYNQKNLYLACLNKSGVAEQFVYFKSIYMETKPYTEQVVNKIPILNRYFKIYTE